MKKCKKCGIEKTLDNFYKNKGMKDGYVNICKDCKKNYSKKNYQEKKDTVEYIEYTKNYLKENKEKINERSKIYREENKEYFKNYREENKEKSSIEYKKWYQKNSSKKLLYKKEYSKNKNELFINMVKDLFNDNCNIVTYIIKSNGFYKIGKTKSLYSRFEKLRYIINIDNVYIINKDIERRLLEEYHEFRFIHSLDFKGKTECFNFKNEIMEKIIIDNNFKKLDIKNLTL